MQEGEREGKSLIDAMDDGAPGGHADLRPRARAAHHRGRHRHARLGLSYATNRTNLQLRLETGGSDIGPTIAAKPKEPVRRTPPPPPVRAAKGAPAAAESDEQSFEDLIER